MKRLFTSILVIIIVVAALAALISVAASAGRNLSGWDGTAEVFEPQVTAPAVLYVKQSGIGDCSTWTEACVLQTALAQAGSGDEIWAAKGIYYPDEGGGQSNNDRTAAFQLKGDLAIFGGFAGDETNRDDRNWEQNVTVLSGDLEGDDVTNANGVITDTANITGTNAYHVVTSNWLTKMAELDGFTITGGNADGSYPDSVGGGMHNMGVSSTLTNIIFSGNEANQGGGGIGNEGGSMIISDSTISGNSVKGFYGGAGILNFGTLTITNCTISDNVGTGEGLVVGFDSFTSVANCTISGNTADSENRDSGGGGGIYIHSFFGVQVVEVKNSIIASNGLGNVSPASGPDVHGAFTSLGYNLVGDATGSTGFTNGVNNDQVGSEADPIDPLLGNLALNTPGSTPTRALLAGSLAIDQGSCRGFTADQRGTTRPVDITAITNVDDGCDIGAYEVQVVAADFEGSPLSGLVPLTVSFSNLSSGDYSSCRWDFGDGKSSDSCNDLEHVYETAGTFTVSLKVSGAAGADTMEKVDYINVSAEIFVPIIVRSGVTK